MMDPIATLLFKTKQQMEKPWWTRYPPAYYLDPDRPQGWATMPLSVWNLASLSCPIWGAKPPTMAQQGAYAGLYGQCSVASRLQVDEHYTVGMYATALSRRDFIAWTKTADARVLTDKHRAVLGLNRSNA